jgi:tRNA nucleotidyltransferase (CCA-adding enzyme)
MTASDDPIRQIPGSLLDPGRRILRSVEAAGGRGFLVGGCVRDAIRGVTAEDIDIEVFGLPFTALEAILSRDFSIDWVGKSFAVFKIRGLAIDVSLPRREKKIGPGHRGFAVEPAPSLSFEEAASRRDFTINAISWDVLNGEIIDPFNGREDLLAGVLRHTGEKFAEDPLRVLRAMQLSARLNFTVAPETIATCRHIAPDDLPAERIFEEWRKLLLRGKRISIGLGFLRDCRWLRYYPELAALDGCPQDPEWHPEGDVWTHTLHCMDAFAGARTGDPHEDLIVGLAVLCHDFGKPATTRREDGRIRSHRHDVEGIEPTRRFLHQMTRQKEIIESVLPLVETHLRPHELSRSNAGDAAIRRLARKVVRIDRLVRVFRADMAGRPPKPPGDDGTCRWLLDRAEALSVKDSAPEPIVKGRHLIDLGLAPGPEFKGILEHCFEAQINGEFDNLEDGLKVARSAIHSISVPGSN